MYEQFFYFPNKMYVMSSHCNCIDIAIPMSTITYKFVLVDK